MDTDRSTQGKDEGASMDRRIRTTPLQDVSHWFNDPRTTAVQEANEDKWLSTLRRQAADSSDPETQANARALLAARGLTL